MAGATLVYQAHFLVVNITLLWRKIVRVTTTMVWVRLSLGVQANISDTLLALVGVSAIACDVAPHPCL